MFVFNTRISPRKIALTVAVLMVAQFQIFAQRRTASPQATLPLTMGWFNGQPTLYTSTDASDPDVAKSFGANYSPLLAMSGSAARNIYVVTNFTQANIVPNAPVPQGPANADRGYSPLWLVNTVTWLLGNTPVVLRSEADVLMMQQLGKITLQKTNVVVNCSILWTPQGGMLPGSNIVMKAGTTPGSMVATGTMPLTEGWFNGQNVLYISPEGSTAGAAGPAGNLSIPLGLAANTPAASPIYVVTNFKQGNVIPSAPNPTGPGNLSMAYTPLWQVTTITWKAGVTPYTLKSEADVLGAISSGNVTATKTSMIVNCPVVYSPLGGMLSGVAITPLPLPTV